MNYSVFRADGKGLVDFDEIALHGDGFVYVDADKFWGGKKSKPYIGLPIHCPTWLDLFNEAMRQQQKTLDFHHCFFEDITVVKISNNPELFRIHLHLGS